MILRLLVTIVFPLWGFGQHSFSINSDFLLSNKHFLLSEEQIDFFGNKLDGIPWGGGVGFSHLYSFKNFKIKSTLQGVLIRQRFKDFKFSNFNQTAIEGEMEYRDLYLASLGLSALYSWPRFSRNFRFFSGVGPNINYLLYDKYLYNNFIEKESEYIDNEYIFESPTKWFLGLEVSTGIIFQLSKRRKQNKFSLGVAFLYRSYFWQSSSSQNTSNYGLSLNLSYAP